MRSLGLDIGDRRIGVALSDPLGILASPLKVIERGLDGEDIAAILELVKQYKVECIIAGMPRSMDGSLGYQAEKVQSFIDNLKMQTAVPVESRDERLTTVNAKKMVEEAGRKKRSKGTRFKKGEYDAAAAAIILQSYLNEARPMEWGEDE